jgi:hypothetical protein
VLVFSLHCYIIVTKFTICYENEPAFVKLPQPKKGTKVRTQTYATETEAKKAAARAYRPAIVRLVNRRYACFQAGNPLPHGARAVSRWGTGQWRAYD